MGKAIARMQPGSLDHATEVHLQELLSQRATGSTVGIDEDPEALVSAAKSAGARLIYLANPDNPMGSHHSAQMIEDMVANLPDCSLLILDEAYADLAPPGTVPVIPADHPQVIRMRTFSKGYGLAGARVGYAITNPELALAFDKVRDHFGMGRISQAGALAAVDDSEL